METKPIRSLRLEHVAEKPICPDVQGGDTTWNQLTEIDKILDRIVVLTMSVVKQSEALREGSLPPDLDLHRRTLHFEARLESTQQCVEDARQVLSQMWGSFYR